MLFNLLSESSLSPSASRSGGSGRRRASERLLLPLLLLAIATPAFGQGGDAEYGKGMLEARRCTLCHPVAGAGEGSAPDLGQRPTTDYSPATLAATMWNHAPKMWREMEKIEHSIPELTDLEMTNLYAYFYSLRYFDPPGDEERGKAVFGSKKCSACHAMAESEDATAPAVSAWLTLADPVAWVQEMWNHSGEMATQMKQRGIAWPEFTLQEMVDLLEYLENLPELGLLNPGMRVGDWSAGEDLFSEKNCAECHTLGETVAGKVDLLATTKGEPHLSGLAVQMWNHRPLMEAAGRERNIEVPLFEADEMVDLVGYLFEKGYFKVHGSAEQGQKVAAAKGCGSCHGKSDSKAPSLAGVGGYSPMLFAVAVWRHGPTMKAQMDYLNKDWPELSEEDVANLIAFMNKK